MKNYKSTVIICSIGIILISIFMMFSTYAYFTVDISGSGKEIVLSTFDKNTTIIYNDTSNVSMVNAYTGDEIIKTFSVENTSNYLLYYDIILKNVVNNFEDKDDLVYILESENAAKREESIIPSKEESIASDILIKPHEKHEYKMTITFVKRDADQSINMNKTFSSNIQIVGSKNINVGQTIYGDNTLLKEIITSSENEESNIYYTNSSHEGPTIYYYKGQFVNNNLVYNDMCFKIIRTDEDNDIRVIYNGEYKEGVCSKENYIAKDKFNTKSNYNAYVGYVFGNASSNNYNNEHINVNNSNIKNILDEWYKEKLFGLKISNKSIFCNNRKTNAFTINGILYSKSGYGQNNTGYYNLDSGIISYYCPNKNDRFSVENNLTNKKLSYPVGLVTVDDVLYSGEGSFLYSDNYWTMTPAYFNGSDAYNYIVTKNRILPVKVNTDFYIRPVISLDKNIILETGDGSIEYPYIVK